MTPDEREKKSGAHGIAIGPFALLPAAPTPLLLGQGHATTVANVEDDRKPETFSVVNELADSSIEMQGERPSEIRKRVITTYVADRLTREYAAEERGYVARVARATKFAPATISAVKDSKRGVGEDLEQALERFWGMKPDELSSTAEAWMSDRPASPTGTPDRPRDPRLDLIEEAFAMGNVKMLRIARALLDEMIADVGNTHLEAAKTRTTPAIPKISPSAESAAQESHKRAADATKRKRRSRSDR